MAERRPDPYDVLGVPDSATAEEIGRAYRRLARRLHPDSATRDASATGFAEAAEAYALLSDPERRREHDRRTGVGLPRRRGPGAVRVPVRHAPRAVSAVLTWPQAVLGTRLLVPTGRGDVVVPVPPGTPAGAVLRVPTADGDLLLTVHVDVPRELTAAQRAAVEALAAVLPLGSPPS